MRANGGCGRTLRNHERHRLTNETDASDCERGPREDIRHHHVEADASGQVKVGGGEHGHDARRRRCSGDIHPPNRGVGQRRPHESYVKTPVLREVVDAASSSSDEARVLAPADGVAENRARSQRLHEKPEVNLSWGAATQAN